MHTMSFGVEDAIAFVNDLVFQQESRDLTSIEIVVIRGAWANLEYNQIAAKSGYSASYISQDAAPKLWRLLTSALHEKVKKSNFKAVLRRSWENTNATLSNPTEALTPSENDPLLNLDSANLDSAADGALNIYVERPPIEARCHKALIQPGALVRIKAPKLMGKTSLVYHLLEHFSASAYRTVNLSFDLADRNVHFTNLDKLLQWMCLNISRELQQEDTLDSTWNKELGSKVSCTTYFEKNLLSKPSQPLVLCLDNVDLLFPYPTVYEDFFGLLRSWYEKGKMRSRWKNLRLIIVHSTDVYIRLNINQSPFNVGLSTQLPEFSQQQTKELAEQNELHIDPNELQTLMNWIGGHPYLLAQVFSFLATHTDTALKDLLSHSHRLIEIYQNHLIEQWTALQGQSHLVTSLSQVVQASSFIQLDPVSTHQLKRLGLIKTSKHGAIIRCQLYKEYFQRYLAKA